MTKQETLSIMATLCALYGQGKGDPAVMAEAWHEMLKEFSFEDVKAGVYNFARNDTRDYATFPGCGKIIAEVRAAQDRKIKGVTLAYEGIARNSTYDSLSEAAKAMITRERYEGLLDTVKDGKTYTDFMEHPKKYKDMILKTGNLLTGGPAA